MQGLGDGPTLYMMGGLPGAGKTTFAAYAAEKANAEHLNSVKMRRSMGLSLNPDPNSPERTREDLHLYAAMDALAIAGLRAGYDVFYDASHSIRQVREKGNNLAKSVGGAAVLVWIDTPLAVAVKRVSARPENDVTSNPPVEMVRTYSLEVPDASEPHIIIDGRLSVEDQYAFFIGIRTA